jgi:hypothetical protein
MMIKTVSVEWLEERDGSDERATPPQDPPRLPERDGWETNVLEDGDRENEIDGLVDER